MSNTPSFEDIPDPIGTLGGSVAWQTYEVNGIACPGVIAIDGIHGFERETGWDRKNGKGTGGATLTMTTWPPAEGSITSWFWKKGQIPDWYKFAQLLEYHSDKVSNTPAANISHPALTTNNIFHVVVHKVGPVRHLGKKLYAVTVDFIEWVPPPKASIVSTPIQPTSVQPDLPGDPALNVANAEADLAQAQAEHAAAAPGQSINQINGQAP